MLQEDDGNKDYIQYSTQMGRRTFAVLLIHLLLWSLVLGSHYAKESLILEKNMSVFFTYGMTISEKTSHVTGMYSHTVIQTVR